MAVGRDTLDLIFVACSSKRDLIRESFEAMKGLLVKMTVFMSMLHAHCHPRRPYSKSVLRDKSVML